MVAMPMPIGQQSVSVVGIKCLHCRSCAAIECCTRVVSQTVVTFIRVHTPCGTNHFTYKNIHIYICSMWSLLHCAAGWCGNTLRSVNVSVCTAACRKMECTWAPRRPTTRLRRWIDGICLFECHATLCRRPIWCVSQEPPGPEYKDLCAPEAPAEKLSREHPNVGRQPCMWPY